MSVVVTIGPGVAAAPNFAVRSSDSKSRPHGGRALALPRHADRTQSRLQRCWVVRQENAGVYRHFAEELYSRFEATPIDQGIIDLLDQRPVNHLLADEPDETELLRVLNNRKCGSAPGGDGKVVDFYKAMCAPGRWRVVPVEA